MSISFSTIVQKLRPSPVASTNLLSDYLSRLPQTVTTALPNGLKIASETTPRTEFATVGIWMNSGSRNEMRNHNGAAKMLQKVALAGTNTYNRAALAKAVEEIGGHLNAYTSRDRTAFYVKCLKTDVGKAVALLAEFVRNAKINDEIVNQQKLVMLNDLKDSEEFTDTQVHDLLHTAAFDSTEKSLGANPLGSERTINALSAAVVSQFKSENWEDANRIALVGCGGVEHEQLASLAKQYFGDLSSSSHSIKKADPSRYVGGDVKLWNLRQKVTHICWAFETCGAESGDNVPLNLINHLYGRFHRSQHDLVNHSSQLILKCLTSMDFCTPTTTHFPEKGVEQVIPFLHSYDDTGLCGLHIVARPESTGGIIDNIWQMIQWTMGDVCRLTQKAVHSHELEQAKVNYKASLLMARDGPTNNAEDIGKQVLQLGRRVPLEEMFARIDDVTPVNMMEVLQHYYYSRRPVLAYNGYVYMTPSYDSVQHWTYKFLY